MLCTRPCTWRARPQRYCLRPHLRPGCELVRPPHTRRCHPTPALRQVDVKLSVRGNPRGKATEAHHQREQTVEITLYTLR